MKGKLILGGGLTVLLVSGCLISSPIVPSDANTYVVSSRSSTCFRCASAATALKDATEFCAKKGKSLVIQNTSGYMDPFGYNSDSKLFFSCLDENDSAGQRSTSPDGTIFVDPAHH
jgi:hypothetical protein